MEMPIIVKAVVRLSQMLPACFAAKMPSGMATTVPRRMEKMESQRVFGQRLENWDQTDRPVTCEAPKSPCRSPHIYLPYRTTIGLSRS